MRWLIRFAKIIMASPSFVRTSFSLSVRIWDLESLKSPDAARMFDFFAVDKGDILIVSTRDATGEACDCCCCIPVGMLASRLSAKEQLRAQFCLSVGGRFQLMGESASATSGASRCFFEASAK